MSGEAILVAENLSVQFGGVTAVDGVSLRASVGEILGIIGPNGAGKTTLFNAMSGIVRPTRGSVSLSQVDVTGWPPHRIAGLGLTRTFQTPETFWGMTVRENVMVGFHQYSRVGLLAAGLSLGRVRRQEESWWQESTRLLAGSALAEAGDRLAEVLAFGQERMLEIFRALAVRPRVLLLDEPLAGLNAAETVDVLGLVRRLRDEGVAVLLVEHDLQSLLATADRVMVLDHGRVIASGDPRSIRQDPAVRAAYIGDDDWD